MTKAPPEILAALMRDSIAGGHAVLIAVAEVTEQEFWMASAGRPGVLPPELDVMHFDYARGPRDRYRSVPWEDVPLGLEWVPWHEKREQEQADDE